MVWLAARRCVCPCPCRAEADAPQPIALVTTSLRNRQDLEHQLALYDVFGGAA